MTMPTVSLNSTQEVWSIATTVNVLKQPASKYKPATSNPRGLGNVSVTSARHHPGAQLPKVEGKLSSQELPSCQAFITSSASSSWPWIPEPRPVLLPQSPPWPDFGLSPPLQSQVETQQVLALSRLSLPTVHPHCLTTEP